MVKTKPNGLVGGRAALFRGREAYASQTSDNDFRAQKTTALLSAFITTAQTTLAAATRTIITFPTVIKPEIQSPIMRQFTRAANSNGKFIAQKDCTCELAASAELTNISTQAQYSLYIVITRGGVEIQHVTDFTDHSSQISIHVKTSALCPRVMDIKRGDIITLEMQVSSGASATYFPSTFSASSIVIRNMALFVKEI